jgi:predicted HicB family RNase H-like nuclease
VETVPVAKKKTEKPSKFVKTWESKPVAFQVRGTPEYKAALEMGAKYDGKSLASLADHAIRLYLRSIGFNEPIPKR